MSATEIDRLEEIEKVTKAAQSDNDVSIDQARWLIKEVKRLRVIEDEALEWSKSRMVRTRHLRESYEKPLWQALQKYPRSVAPES